MAKAAKTNVVRLDTQQMLENADGFVNTVTGIGVLGQDKRLGGTAAESRTRFVPVPFSRHQGMQMWQAHDLAATIVEALPEDAYREGWNTRVPKDPKMGQELDAFLEDLGAQDTMQEAESMARAGGGSVVVMGVDDGLSPDVPLDLTRVKGLEWMNVLSPDQIKPWALYDDPFAKSFGKPSVYQVTTNSTQQQRQIGYRQQLIHESRIMRFNGVLVGDSAYQANQQDGWGDSVLRRPFSVLRDFELSWANAAVLLQEFAIGIFKFKDLAELMSADKDDVVIGRMRLMNMSKSSINAMMMDAEESFERLSTSLQGYPEMLQQFIKRMSAAARMPATRLMGQSPDGLNATGAADIRFWYDFVGAYQKKRVRPRANLLTKIVFAIMGKEPDNWVLKFPSLWKETAKEEADRRFTMAQADEKYLMQGVFTAEECAESRFGGDEFDMDVSLDQAARDALKKALATEADPDTAFNGAQVAAMLEIVAKVAAQEIPRETGVAMIATAFPVTPEEAEHIMGPAGRDFEPKPKAPPPNIPGAFPPGGQRQPPPPRETLNNAD